MRPTFGQMIRAARLGYHWSPKHEAMIRIADCGPHFEIRLCPPDQLPKGPDKTNGPEYHRCWWEEKSVDVLSMIEPLKRVKAVHARIRFLVDNDGRMVGGTR